MSCQDSPEPVDMRIEQARRAALNRRDQWLTSRRGRVQVAVSTVVSFLLLCLASLATLMVATGTLFQKRRYYTETMARRLAETLLRVAQVRLVVLPERVFPQKQVMYLFNHTSTLDMFVLLALGLPETRYFLSGKVRRVVPLGIIATLMRTFFTPPQTRPAARAACFQHAEGVLRRTGASVCLSPEGTRVTNGRIGAFNKGAFHLATNLKLPIVPLYIEIPPGVDPGKGVKALPGTAYLHILPEIRTDDWTLEELDKNREKVRSVYLDYHWQLARAALAANSAPAGAAGQTGA